MVETLQANRSEVVHLLDQLVRQLPDGLYLRSVKQNGAKVTLIGYAQSNARVSTLMRNIESSPWLGSPELVEIKSVALDKQKVNEFTLNRQIKRPTDPNAAQPGGAPGVPNAPPSTTPPILSAFPAPGLGVTGGSEIYRIAPDGSPTRLFRSPRSSSIKEAEAANRERDRRPSPSTRDRVATHRSRRWASCEQPFMPPEPSQRAILRKQATAPPPSSRT